MNVPRTRSITARLILIVSLLVIPVSAKATIYWNLFNSEGDITSDAIYVTYATLDDMLNDTKRTGFSVPDGGFAGTQIIGAGTDGISYWNLFNSEGNITSDAIYTTYATLDDMLNDTNRTGFGVPDGGFAGTQIVGTGSDGSEYWSLFNSEGDITSDAVIATYATLTDMMNDTNRIGFGVPDGGLAGTQIVDSGATLTAVRAVPEPATWAMMLLGLGAAGFALRGRRRLLQRPA
jgi:hypothetical protein